MCSDRERASDEKQVEKLFRDITTGMLRRKRGADFDLSDSDDGGEARRRMKRRQFAKMQKALFADERIEKIAENPRNLAFLRSIEDRDDDDEPGILDDIFPSTVRSGSESQEQDDADFVVPDSQPDGAAVSGKGKTKAPLNPRPANGVVAERLPANQRRTKDGKRPSNLSEVRESLSTLLDESSMASLIDAVPDTDLSSSDDEGDGSEDADADDEYPGRKSNDGSPRSVRGRDKENRSPAKLRRPTGTGRVEKPTRVSPQKMGSQHGANVRRHGVTAVKATIIDRISLKRRDSSMSSDSASASTGGRMAFGAAPSTGAGSAAAAAFKVPALLRRVTTSSLLSNGSGSSSSTSQSASGSGAAKKDGSGNGFGDDARLKRTASKRSGVNYFAREIERRAALAEKEKRREARKWKGAEGRLAVVGGLFGKGTFE